MARLLLLLLVVLPLIGCAPKTLVVPAPPLAAVPAAGPEVRIAYPVDVRPAGDRRDGGYYASQVPLPQLQYGDASLRPAPIDAVDRAARIGLASRGVPVVEEGGDWEVRLHVLRHAGTRDISDAQWVSTLTGGTAGAVGKFVYPMFTEVRVAVRVEIRDREGALRAVRDVEVAQVERRSVARTWGLWSLWRRNQPREMFEAAFAAAHEAVAREIAEVVVQVLDGREPTAGVAPIAPAQTALALRWHRADSLELADDEGPIDPLLAEKYPSRRFSLITGHDTAPGEVVGRLSLPLDTFGYEVGLARGVQGQIGLTVLGAYNAFGGGLRLRLLEIGPVQLALQGRLDGNVVILRENDFVPVVAGLQSSGSALVSFRPKNVTWFVQGGGFGVAVYREFAAFPELKRGRVLGIVGGPGLEYQLTTTTLFAIQLRASAQFQNGNPLALGPIGSFLVIPQVALGFR